MRNFNLITRLLIMLTALMAFVMVDSNLIAQCNGTCAGYGTYSHNYLTAGGNDAERNCENNAEGDCSFASGTRCVTTVNADFSIAAGIQATVEAPGAYAFGNDIQIQTGGQESYLFGSNLSNNAPQSFMLGWGSPLLYADLGDPAGTGFLGINRTVVGNGLPVDVDLSVQGEAEKTGGGPFLAISDRRLKTDIEPFEDGLEVLMEINPVWFRYNGKLDLPTENKYVGVIAQEVKKFAPYMVKGKESENSYLGYDANALWYILVNSVQEQQKVISEQDRKLNDYEVRISDLESKMSEILNARSSSTNGSRTTTGSVKNVSISNVSIEEPMLFQNEPNPFTGSTTIRYYVPEKVADAEIIVASTENGQVLKRISIDQRGLGAINLNIENVTSGNYTYALILDGMQKLSKQMMIGR